MTPACRRIVLVDDDDSLRRALARTIRLAGYAVEAFACAEDCARASGCLDDACLVLDINLPGTGGVDFRKALTAAGHNPPTIFITALDREDAALSLASLPPATVLHKPFANETLLRAIRDACN
jgi:FixJ family two-component response regulator